MHASPRWSKVFEDGVSRLSEMGFQDVRSCYSKRWELWLKAIGDGVEEGVIRSCGWRGSKMRFKAIEGGVQDAGCIDRVSHFVDVSFCILFLLFGLVFFFFAFDFEFGEL